MKKAIVKYNGGLLALLCSGCRVIIKTGESFTQEELDYAQGKLKKPLPPQYCKKCNHDSK